jgi:hypothetical protein
MYNLNRWWMMSIVSKEINNSSNTNTSGRRNDVTTPHATPLLLQTITSQSTWRLSSLTVTVSTTKVKVRQVIVTVVVNNQSVDPAIHKVPIRS